MGYLMGLGPLNWRAQKKKKIREGLSIGHTYFHSLETGSIIWTQIWMGWLDKASMPRSSLSATLGKKEKKKSESLIARISDLITKQAGQIVHSIQALPGPLELLIQSHAQDVIWYNMLTP